jgi:hypothetical protein
MLVAAAKTEHGHSIIYLAPTKSQQHRRQPNEYATWRMYYDFFFSYKHGCSWCLEIAEALPNVAAVTLSKSPNGSIPVYSPDTIRYVLIQQSARNCHYILGVLLKVLLGL